LCSPSFAQGYFYSTIDIDNIHLNYIEYSIDDPIYRLDVQISEKATELSELAKSHNALTGLNGIFFCPEDYSQCGGKNYTINERFIDGEDLSFYEDTGERWVFAWDEFGLPFLFMTGKINPEKRDEIYEGMGNFPILLLNGQDTIPYYAGVWLLDKKMTTTAPRHFICSNKERTSILFWRVSSLPLSLMPKYLSQIWCYNALNLDAWYSSHMIINGAQIVDARRNILDGFFISSPFIQTSSVQADADSILRKINTFSQKYSPNQQIQIRAALKEYLKKIKNTLYESIEISNDFSGYRYDFSDIEQVKKIYRLNMILEGL
jgi:hypothetical protein